MAASFRVVASPSAGTDATEHSITLTGAVAPGETVVLLVGCSVTVLAGIVGYADANGGALVPTPYVASQLSWSLDFEYGGGGEKGISCLSCYCPDGLASGTTIRYGVKWDGSAFYHGQSPFAVAIALNSGDGRFMVFDTGSAGDIASTSTPTTGSIVTANDAIALGFFVGVVQSAAGWFTPGSGWTELADTAQGTESLYNIAAEGRVATTSYSGTASGTSALTKTFSGMIVSYKATPVEPVKTPIILAGTRETGVDPPTADFFANGNTAAWPFVAAASGVTKRVFGRFTIDNALVNSVKLGIYSHDSVNNRPLTLLGSATVSPNPTAKVPFGAPLFGVEIIQGTTYWLAYSGAGEQMDIAGVASAAVGREGTGNMVTKWVNAGNMGVQPGIWVEGIEFTPKFSPGRMPGGV